MPDFEELDPNQPPPMPELGPLAVPTGTTKPLPMAGPLEPSVFLPAKADEREGAQLYQRREAPKFTLGERLSPPGSPSRKAFEYGLQGLAVALTPLAKATEAYDKWVEGTALPNSEALFFFNPGLKMVGGLEQAAIMARLQQAGRATVGRAIETGAAAAGIPGTAPTVAARIRKKPITKAAASIEAATEMPITKAAAAKAGETNIDDAIRRFQAEQGAKTLGDVPKPALETEAAFVTRRMKELRADAKAGGFTLIARQPAILREEYRAALKPSTSAAGQRLPPVEPAAPIAPVGAKAQVRTAHPGQSQVGAAPTGAAFKPLPSGRIPGGPRAVPLEPAAPRLVQPQPGTAPGGPQLQIGRASCRERV